MLCLKAAGSTRDRRRVLIHIKIIVEVRDVRPLNGVSIVDGHYTFRLTMIFTQQVAIDFREFCTGQWFASFSGGMYGQLELTKHGLTEEGAADAFQCLPQIEEFFFFGIGVGDHVFLKQDFVDGRCHLRNER